MLFYASERWTNFKNRDKDIQYYEIKTKLEISY